jgi:hypothetical protein
MNNELASSVFNYLKSFYNEKHKAHHVHSFVNQPEILNKITVVNRTSGSRLTNTLGQEIKDKESIIVHKRYEKTR